MKAMGIDDVAKVIVILLVASCTQKQPDPIPDIPSKTYQFLPENLTAYNEDHTISARYVDPTLRYDHGVLGDKIEAGGLLVVKNNKEYYYRLDTNFVFEDLQPRLKDVDNDGELEFITIQTSLQLGASVAVYKIIHDKLVPFVQSNYIGSTHRWLNIAAIDDLDHDGNTEIAWIQTPHIGGDLRIGRIEGNSLRILDELAGVSNHQNGSTNLCLSVVTNSIDHKRLYVPNDPHDALIGFRFQDGHLIPQDTLLLNIDMNKPLFMQYDFLGAMEDRNCIFIPGRANGFNSDTYFSSNARGYTMLFSR